MTQARFWQFMIITTLCITALVIFGPLQAAYTTVFREVANTFSAVQTFARPVAFTTSTATAPATGIKFDADTGSLDVYKSGSLTTQQRTNEWIAPDCDSDGPDSFGGFCKQQTDGKLYYRDAGGVKALP